VGTSFHTASVGDGWSGSWCRYPAATGQEETFGLQNSYQESGRSLSAIG